MSNEMLKAASNETKWRWSIEDRSTGELLLSYISKFTDDLKCQRFLCKAGIDPMKDADPSEFGCFGNFRVRREELCTQ